jgi:DNA-binding Lrp family transcriptional regulator
MDERDKELLNAIQAGFPVASHPYRLIGATINMNETEVMARIEGLRNEGIIRRIGASIDSRRLGFVSTLCAARVPQDRFESFVDIVGACPGVTHNYERKHEYNVWFTLIASSQEEKDRIIKDLIRETEIEILELPAKKIFKIRVDFRF